MKLPLKQNYDSLRRNGQLNDVTCLVARDIFNHFQYRGDYAEDLDLGIRLIQAGYQIALLSDVYVIHSHTRPAIYYLKRGLVDVMTLKKILPDMPVENISAQTIANRVVSAYCTAAHYMQAVLDHSATNERWQEFCAWTEAQKVVCISKVKSESSSSLRNTIENGILLDYDRKFADFVLQLFNSFEEDFAFDSTTIDEQFYYITRILTRYFTATGEVFDESKPKAICELMVKHLGMCSGNMLAAYAVTHIGEGGVMNQMIQVYRQGV